METRLTNEEKETLGELYKSHLYVLDDLMRKYCFCPSAKDDVFQQASIYMVELIRKYNSALGVPLKNYLYIYLKGRVQRFAACYFDTILEKSVNESMAQLSDEDSFLKELLPSDLTEEDSELLTQYYVHKKPVKDIENGNSPIKNWRKIQTLLERLRRANA